MNAGGYQTPGPGNGAPARLNTVATTDLWRRCRGEIERDYPWLVEARLFDLVEVLMIVLDVEEDARRLGGDTWLVETPDDALPIVSIYFTYVNGHIVLRAAYAADI